MVLQIEGVTVLTYVMASLRIVAWLVIVPPFSTRAVPVLAKTLLALGLALAVAPQLQQAEAFSADAGTLIVAAVQEVMIGATMGFVTFLLFAAVQAAGDLIDTFGGFSLAAAFDPLNQTFNSIHGKLFSMLATMLLFASNAHLLVIGGLLKTFEYLPVGSTWQPDNATDVVTTAFGVFFTSAVQIALPLIAVLFVADLGLALLTKVAPQLNAIGIMFPAKIGLTLLVVGMSFAVLPDALTRLVETVSDATKALGITS
jgi:flagellar biosynthetic protein FliR